MNTLTQPPVIEMINVTRRYKDTMAVDGGIDGGKIYGLLGRNGAGKTTLMSILTAQDPQTSGDVKVFGEHPYENDRVLSRMCFIRGWFAAQTPLSVSGWTALFCAVLSVGSYLTLRRATP